jgi:hypothetical protein
MLLFREKDKEFAQFIYDSGIAITSTHVKSTLSGILQELARQFRVFPNQGIRKSCTGTPDELASVIAKAVSNQFTHDKRLVREQHKKYHQPLFGGSIAL